MSRIDATELADLKARTPLSDLFGRYGVRGKGRTGSRVIWAPCCFHAEKTASLKINDERGTYHCLAAETKVLTWDGTRRIDDLAGSTHRILARGGEWIDAPFRSFGFQRLWEIYLSRNGVRKTIRATSAHRWFIRAREGRNPERTTDALRPGDRLEAALPTPNFGELDPDGIRHGIVLGDGTLCADTGARAVLYGEKRATLGRFFDGMKAYRYDDRTIIPHQKRAWKRPPLLDAPVSYLRGFLAGFIAADGHVAKDGTVILNQSRIDRLQAVRDIATRLGIVTFSITTQMRIGIGQTEPSPIHRIHFATSTMQADMFLNPLHRERFEASHKKFERFRWRVVGIRQTDAVEEVFCAEVPRHHAFALEDNLLTGNCFGCGANGDHLDVLRELGGKSFGEAVEVLGGARLLTTEERAAIAERQRKFDEEERKEKERARTSSQRLFDGAKPIAGTHAAAYLAARHLPVVPRWTFDLRFVAELPYRGFADAAADDPTELGAFPAMVAAIRDRDGKLIGLHRTYLDPDKPAKLTPPGDARRNKAKKVLGEQRGGMILLSPPAKTLAMGEGIETSQAWYALGMAGEGDVAIAAAVSLGNMSGSATGSSPHPKKEHATVPNGIPDPDRPGVILPRHVETVILIGDGDSDPYMTRARLLVAARRFHGQGVGVQVSMAPAGLDFADVLARESAA